MSDSTRDPQCIFCRIIAGEIPSKKLLETDDALVIEDNNPRAPVHVLSMPKRHITSIAHLSPADAATLAAVVDAATTVARQKGLEESGYRLVVNHGADAGQSVPHLHIHVLGGRAMGWPPFPAQD